MCGKEISVILPCLNEELGIGICINKIQEVFVNNNINGEIIVVDNGCTDNTIKIAKGFNVKIVYEPRKGYGNAYRAGFKIALGRMIIMGDADNTYDFYDIPRFLYNLNNCNVVLGSRFKGKMNKGSMPWLHKNLGNPMMVRLMRLFHGLNLSEPSTGFVAIRKSDLNKMDLYGEGMEFAPEFLIESHRQGFKIKEIPINYGNRLGNPKLRTFRDGFRYLSLITSKRAH